MTCSRKSRTDDGYVALAKAMVRGQIKEIVELERRLRSGNGGPIRRAEWRTRQNQIMVWLEDCIAVQEILNVDPTALYALGIHSMEELNDHTILLD